MLAEVKVVGAVIHLCLLPDGSLEADHRFTRWLRPQLQNPLANDGVAAAKASGAQLLMHPDRSHVRVTLQEFTDEVVVLIQRTRSLGRPGQLRRRRLAGTLPLEARNHLLDCRPGHAQLAGNLPLRRLGLPALDDLVA